MDPSQSYQVLLILNHEYIFLIKHFTSIGRPFLMRDDDVSNALEVCWLEEE